MIDIDEFYYCLTENYRGEGCEISETSCAKENCICYRHKWPTPEQYKKEYDRELQDEDAIYFLAENEPDLYSMPREKYAQWWQVEQYCEVKDVDGASEFIVCACTPFGKPPDEWRPE
jgi:hypothetical protein